MIEINVNKNQHNSDVIEYDLGTVPNGDSCNIIDKPISTRKLEKNDIFYGSITTVRNGKRIKIRGTFKVHSKGPKGITVEEIFQNKTYNTSIRGTKVETMHDKLRNKLSREDRHDEPDNDPSDENQNLDNNSDQNSDNNSDDNNNSNEVSEEVSEETQEDFENISTEQRLRMTVEAGINNIWMVGPAGCGKSTIARNIANELGIPYLCISCGIGTSATEFVGYKYPTRESTKFAEYYSKPSIILLDEFTALDPAIAQVCNSTLANDEIETTTGLVKRHPNCVIIATSNTFGNGADRQYVANNQLDSSTIDRFIGGIIEVDYSEEYESQYDSEVVEFVNDLRYIIKENDLRRIASTRMIQAGHKLKKFKILDWKERLIINWTQSEKEIVYGYFDLGKEKSSLIKIAS